MASKPKVIKDYDKVGEEILQQIKLKYPYGFEKFLITFKDHKNKLVSALPFEAEDREYMVRMTTAEAQNIIADDDDYNENGVLKDSIKEEYEQNLLELAEEIELPDEETE